MTTSVPGGKRAQQRLYFFPLPQGHGSLRPTFRGGEGMGDDGLGGFDMNLEERAQHLRQGWEQFRLSVARPQACISCGHQGRICWDGNGLRGASVLVDGQMVHVTGMRYRRVTCRSCGEGWALLPPGMIPSKHYQPCVVASATSRYLFDEGASQDEIAAAHGCSRRTVGRWLRWVAGLAATAVLASMILAANGEVVLPGLRRVAALARKARSAATRAMLERAAEILGLMEALGSAWGLEPPGLRSVLERVLGGRADLATHADPLIPDLARSPCR